MNYRRIGSAFLFGVILILFFLPFADPIDHNEMIGSNIKGWELASGYFLQNHMVEVKRNNFASASLVLALAGFVLSLLIVKKRESFISFIGLSGALCLMLMKMYLEKAAKKNLLISDSAFHGSLMNWEFKEGYWLSLLCFLIAGLMNMFHFMKLKHMEG